MTQKTWDEGWEFLEGVGESDAFGHADLAAAQAAGKTASEIQSYVNKQKMGQTGMGIRADHPKLFGDLADKGITAIKHKDAVKIPSMDVLPAPPPPAPAVDWGSRLDDMMTAYNTQLQTYMDQQKQQQDALSQRQAQYQQQQTAWQQQQAQAQAAHNRAMLAAQNQIRSSTATTVRPEGSPMFIRPGRGAAPQSAADLGRKATSAPSSLASGLNIGGATRPDKTYQPPKHTGIR